MIFEAVREAIISAAESGLREATEEVRTLARKFCPVESGTLKESIEAESNGLSGSVTAGASYGAYVELGSREKAARPFLFPAFSLVKGTIAGRIAGKM